MKERFRFGSARDAKADGDAVRYRVRDGRGSLAINSRGSVATKREYGGEDTPFYRVEVVFSWGRGDGLTMGLAGLWLRVSTDGLLFKNGWSPPTKATFPPGRKHALHFRVSTDGLAVDLNGKKLGAHRGKDIKRSAVVLRGWKGDFFCHRLAVVPLDAPAGHRVGRKDKAPDADAAPPPPIAPGADRDPELCAVTQSGESDVLDKVVIVGGKEGAGTGFVTEVLGKTVVASNAHVFVGNPNVRIRDRTGQQLRFSDVYLARSTDIVLFELADENREPLPIELGFDQRVSRGDPVIVYGNSQGMGTITATDGRVLSFGPDRIETSANFVQGNSGSPIVSTKTGTVIGVATFAINPANDWVARGTRFSQVRRFGLRLDRLGAEQFQRLDPRTYTKELAVLRDVERALASSIAILGDLSRSATLAGEAHDDDRLGKLAEEWNNEVDAALRKGGSQQLARRACGRLREIQKHLQRPFERAGRHEFAYDGFAAMFKEMSEVNVQVAKQFDAVVARLSKLLGRKNRRR